MKRFVCFLLAMILIMGMVPATAVTASAASNLATSTKAIELLKEFEGFAEDPYKDGDNWYIGYGTQISSDSLYPNGISKNDATTLLKNYLKKVDNALNAFTAKNNLTLEQYEHDALAVFCYNIGYGWLETGTGPLRKAVLEGKGGNELINAFAQNAVTPDSAYFDGSINRRLAEANMYLNNSYAYYAPDNFTYVILDMDGDKVADADDKVIGYDSNIGMTLAETATKTGETFMGWYFESRRGDQYGLGYPVDYLDEETAGEMLVAKFSSNGTGDTADARYYIHTSYLDSRRVYDKTYTKAEYEDNISEERKGTLAEDSYFLVRKEAMIDGLKWLHGEGEDRNGDKIDGWVVYGRLPAAEEDYQTPLATAKANQSLKIYEGASTNSKEIGKLNAGTVVNLYAIKAEETETGNRSWGKIINVKDANGNTVSGWINLVYTTVNEITDDSTVTYEYGVIVNAANVNVRSNPEVVNDPSNVITTLRNGTEIYILDTYMNGANQWALVEWDVLKDGYTQGWVLMYYVEVEGYEHTSPDGSGNEEDDEEPVLYTGVVNSPNMNLNVREYPSASTKKLTSLKHGTQVNIYETTTYNGVEWGRIYYNNMSGWICLQYVNLTQVEAPKDDVVTDEGITTLQGTVTTTSLNVLKNYNSNAEVVGTLEKGETVTILEKNTEITTTGSRIWGRIVTEKVAGWINLAYVDLKTVTTVNPGNGSSNGTTTADPIPAVVTDCISVNVRSGAGTGNTSITKLNNGTAVTVYEQVTKDGAPWARIKWNNGANEGWVCMYYLTLNAGTGSTNTNSNGIINGTSSNTISATGSVNNVYLNVRAGAGLGFAQIGTLNQGAKVTIFEQAVADGLIWGRINYNNTSGWVCMTYITVESASSTGQGVMGTVARCFSKANVRSAPGTGNAIVATVTVGSRVEVFETKTHANQLWGRIAQGWICMEYVLLDSELPEGTILDATTAPTTEATTPTVDATVNKEGEVAFKIEAGVLTNISVYNDANAKSVRVGTVVAGLGVDILALKNNGAELWGRIDQYGTAGWICLSDGTTTYAFKGYVNVEDAPVYVEANTTSAVKGSLPVNKEMTFTKVTTDGDNVYGWVEENIYGWLPMSKISSNPIDVTPVLKSGDNVGSGKFNPIILHGTTFTDVTAYDVIGGSKVMFKMKSGVNVNVTHIRFENGKIWGRVEQPKKPGFHANWLESALDSGEYSEYGEAWFDLSKVTYTLAGKVEGTVRVRSSMDNSTTESSNPNNIVGKINGTISICQLAFDSYGNLWARITGNANAQLNGMFVMVRSAAQGVDGYTVKNYGELYISTDLTPNDLETAEGSEAIEAAEPAAVAEGAEETVTP